MSDALFRVVALEAVFERTQRQPFYRHHGFIALPDSPLTLFLPLATVRQDDREKDTELVDRGDQGGWGQLQRPVEKQPGQPSGEG